MDAMDVRKKSLAKFEQDAPAYEKTSDGRFCARAYPAVLAQIGAVPFTALLDVGCGTGAVLSKITRKARLCGIDLSPSMISRAKEALGDTAELVVGDAEALPWPDGTFDAVCCTFSFHHYPRPEKVLAEMNRVLSKGGRLILTDPWMPSPFLQLMNWAMRYAKSGDRHMVSKREIQTLLAGNGFALQSFVHPTGDSFLAAARKEDAPHA